MRHLLKIITPPILWTATKYIFRSFTSRSDSEEERYGWFGDYENWEDAKNESVGYDNDPEIISLVKKLTSNKRIDFNKNNKLIDNSNLRLIACINHILNSEKSSDGSFQVLDFGGALGQHYLGLRNFLNLQNISWNICETLPMVKEGLIHFQTKELKFFESFNSLQTKFDLVLLSGVLQYVEKPLKILENIISKKPKFILIDRFPMVPFFDEDRICIQNVNYGKDTSYPSRFFSKKWEYSVFKQLELLYEWHTDDGYTFEDCSFNFKGYFFKLRN